MKAKTTLSDLRGLLASAGYSIANDSLRADRNQCRWYAYRRSPLPARNCECNSDKRGAQIVVTPYEAEVGERLYQSVEISLTGECEQWFKLMAYSIGFDDLSGSLERVEEQLVASWNALGGKE